jgi:hypothetical protein
MHARYFGSTTSRFLSVDPALDARAALRHPEMWNRYAYVLNNPPRYLDPTGLAPVLVHDAKGYRFTADDDDDGVADDLQRKDNPSQKRNHNKRRSSPRRRILAA